VPDAHFDHPRLAAIYDDLDRDRGDLDVYRAIVAEVGAHSVLDVGCGTGTFAVSLAAAGVDVWGVDPAAGSLAVAQAKPGGDRVHWLHGDAGTLPPLQVELAVMTGNVAQAIVEPADWAATLRGVHAALRPGGRFVFETRDPAARGWVGWTRERTYRLVDLPGVGPVENWEELTEVALPLLSFRTTFVFGADGAVLTSDSTLRFRTRDEVVADLSAAGFVVDEVRDAPDRPGLEFVFFAHR
jgi:SAM-dependent methyltransferase